MLKSSRGDHERVELHYLQLKGLDYVTRLVKVAKLISHEVYLAI